MKNKTKKILAAACLGVMGAATLTGCSMSDEDLKKWETKSDTVIETLTDANEQLTEQNKALTDLNNKYAEIIDTMKQENAVISKKEALEMIFKARQLFAFSQLEQFKISGETFYYDGYFLKESGENKLDFTYKKDGNMWLCNYKQFEESESEAGNQDAIYKMDLDNDIYYSYAIVSEGNETPEESFKLETSQVLSRVVTQINYDPTYLYSLDSAINEDNIYDIEVIDGGYKISFCADHCDTFVDVEPGKIEIEAARVLFDICIVDGRITSMTNKFVRGEYTTSNTLDNLTFNYGWEVDEDGNIIITRDVVSDILRRCENVESRLDTMSYEYDNIDFTQLNEKIVAIEDEYLTNE